jgi:hypothetical protein
MLQVVKAPDLGTDRAEVIEILVKAGQSIAKEMPRWPCWSQPRQPWRCLRRLMVLSSGS